MNDEGWKLLAEAYNRGVGVDLNSRIGAYLEGREPSVRALLGDVIRPDDSLHLSDAPRVSWSPDFQNALFVYLSGSFTADGLEAIAFWMRLKEKPE